MNIIPFRQAETVTTDALADTEAMSSIPPWPFDYEPKTQPVEPDPIEGAGAVVVPLLVLVAVCCTALIAALW